MKRCHVEETALEFAKTLITSNQPELIEDAEDAGIYTSDAVATLSFDFAEAFHREADKRREQ